MFSKADVIGIMSNTEPLKVIQFIQNYLMKISVVPENKTKENLKGRTQYLSEETTDILIHLIHSYGSQYPKEVINLVSSQEYTVHHRICNKFNLFKYLVNHADLITNSNHSKLQRLISLALSKCSLHLYNKDVYSSYGMHGNGYYGFTNNLYSKIVKNTNGNMEIRFQLHIDVQNYNLVALGDSLGVSPKNLSGLLIPSTYVEEEVFEKKLNMFVKELSFPDKTFKTNVLKKFATETDIDTEFFISVEKTVPIKNNYDALRKELISTIKTFNKIEENHFMQHMKN